VVQANRLAAKAFADELHPLITRMDVKEASRMTAGFENCMQALHELKETLVISPDLDDDEDE
jgi:hypothetical protein